MLDFLMVSTRRCKKDKEVYVDIYPKFIMKYDSTDLMIRGGDFYAIWDEEAKRWSTEEGTALYLIDKEMKRFYEENKDKFDCPVYISYMWDADSGSIDRWHKYVQKQMRDTYHALDEKLIFANTEVTKNDYASKRLNYPLEAGPIDAYEELISTLYFPEERKKIEWSIGAIVSGESKDIQKFLVMYGSAGTGKSTILNIIQKLFEGYYSVFDAKALGSATNVFALEAFKSNPLVAIQHDGDLSRIEDNTRLNSVVSHELMTVNEKFKSSYTNKFNCFLFVGTNKPVKITDAKSGIIRRLIDVSPSGNKIPPSRYKKLVEKIDFELGGIAKHCLDVYESDKGAYDNYIPITMLGASNDFYNFILDSFEEFSECEGISLKSAWERYKNYCDDAKVSYPYPLRIFREELKNYFESFEERSRADDGTRVRNYYKGFKTYKFDYRSADEDDDYEEVTYKLDLKEQPSLFDQLYFNEQAQYASSKETPLKAWDRVTDILGNINTKMLHYVRVPENHIVIDFDLKDENGNKSLEMNLEAASKFPPTYTELSKSGKGVHLHYIYSGDVNNLRRIYKEGVDIEVKVFTGKSSLRRKLTLCNDIPIATLCSGLPLKGEKRMLDFKAVKSQRELIRRIENNLNKEYMGSTKPSMDLIYKILEDAYDSGLVYDITSMRPKLQAFAANSTNQADYCLKLLGKMKLKSEDVSVAQESKGNIIFFDVEVFPNLFVVVWKAEGKDPITYINPTPEQIESLTSFKLVGFNNRKYDNHIMYARLMGYSNRELYNLSQRIINGSRNAFFGDAYNLSYADIYEFSSKKQSLKKFEIELGIHHQELGLPWDQPVPEELWTKVAEYCVNDVVATEAVFNARKQDFVARQILADLSGLTVNDTTRMHTTKIIFGDNKKPDLVYTDLSEMFPGYIFEYGRSEYMGEEPGEGGYVYAEPGIHCNVALLDIASMHPTSIINLNLFGSYTKNFKDILDARLNIKHHDFESAKKLLNGVLTPYLVSDEQADSLAQALKIVINSVYGFTTATFDNPFKDPRNVDNIVAKRGSLFMINLKHEVQKRGYTVAHIKTDSIKIPDATPEIIEFVMEYGRQYGYTFEHEATYEKMCLVNDAVYIAKVREGKHAGEWTAVGAQFQHPYVFKKLFSKEPIEFKDLCETKTVSSALYLDFNEDLEFNPLYERIFELRVKRAAGKNLTKSEIRLLDEYDYISPEELSDKIGSMHKYTFVGKAGSFCPIKEGCGGGLLMREKDGKYYNATGAKGYRWIEAEVVQNLNKQNDIEELYFMKLVDDAVDTIGKYGDAEWFMSDEPYISTNDYFPNIPEDVDEEIPFDED